MKKLALLLAALGVMSATAFAEESALKITSIGQEVEIENDSGSSNIGESVFFGTIVNIHNKDWSFGVTGAKRWNMDTEYVDSVTGRLQLDAMKNFGNYSLGARLRSEKDYDRWYLRGAWNHNMLWGAADVWYQTNEGKNDTWKGEIYPIGVQYNGIKLGWFIDVTKTNGGLKSGDLEQSFEHQLRFYAPLYKGEKLSLNTEIRHTLTVDDKFKDEEKSSASRYEDFGRTRVYLKSNYKIDDSWSVYLNYGYEFRNKEYVADGKSDENKNYYGVCTFGWKYNF